MESINEKEMPIKITANELIAEVKKDLEGAKAKYNNKIMIISGDITKTRLDIFDWIWLNKYIACEIETHTEKLKEAFKEENLRYAVKGNKNVKVKGKLTFGIAGKIIMKDCDLSIDRLYAQDPDEVYNNAEVSAKLSKKILWIVVAIAVISFPLSFINLGGAFFGGVGMLISGIALFFAIFLSVDQNNQFIRSATANTLSSGAEGVNIPAHVGSTASWRIFSRKLILSEIYKVSVSPKNWKNVPLDRIAKKFISSNTVFANSLKGVFIQLFLLIPYLITVFIILISLAGVLNDESGDLATFIAFTNALIVYIAFNSLFLARSNSLQVKYAKEITQNQKNWINSK